MKKNMMDVLVMKYLVKMIVLVVIVIMYLRENNESERHEINL